MYRGELHCFSCARYLGEFESHPSEHGAGDVHVIAPPVELAYHAIETERGLRCSACGGRVLAEQLDRIAA
jgi:hypothetical protein